jgi:hypothetical protein
LANGKRVRLESDKMVGSTRGLVKPKTDYKLVFVVFSLSTQH